MIILKTFQMKDFALLTTLWVESVLVTTDQKTGREGVNHFGQPDCRFPVLAVEYFPFNPINTALFRHS